MTIVACSGGYDPVHVGHIRQFAAARSLGDRLVVILNGDSFLMRKKGFVFMPATEREELLRSCRFVDDVILFDSDEDTVVGALDLIKPDVFAKGGDRNSLENIPEWDYCQVHGIQVVTGVGGYDKAQSSQWLTAKLKDR